MVITLDRLSPGREALVMDVAAQDGLKRRLSELGLVPGTLVQCRYRSPDGGVSAIFFRGSVLALRSHDMKRITVRTE